MIKIILSCGLIIGLFVESEYVVDLVVVVIIILLFLYFWVNILLM